MCLIAYAPAGKGSIPAAVIDAAMTRHPDGFGIVWRDLAGKVPALRTATFAPGERAAFRAALAAVNKPAVEFAAHFRLATSGPKDADMAHPYTYDDPDPKVGQVAVLHNGIIDIAHDRVAESDTAAFVRLVLARLPSRWWTQPALVFLVNGSIGWSRLVIMTATETINLQERAGDWDGGVWYSSPHRPTATKRWTPARQTAASNPKPARRGQRRQRKAAIVNGKVVSVTAARPADPRGVPDTERVMTHAGHVVSLTMPIDRMRDSDYVGGVICAECETVGDAYHVDGKTYFDLSHFATDELPWN